ncbi:MAG: hypothetical protein FWD46_08800 [Cystobacterineae bacterium]|nr:hypothetical protein [Cystobacterineae bacterium]
MNVRSIPRWLWVLLGILLLSVLAVLLRPKPVFVTPETRLIGEPTSEKPDSGYLRVAVNSNIDALDAFKVDKGYRYLSAGVTVAHAGSLLLKQAPPEYPLLLVDLEKPTVDTVAAISVAHGEYVDFNSTRLPELTFYVRAIPKTIAGAYAEAFKTFQSLSAGIPLSQLDDTLPYLSFVSQLLNNIVKEADPLDTETSKKIGLDPKTSPFPLDGRTTVIFLRRSNDTTPLPDASMLKTLRRCSHNRSDLCLDDGQTIYTSPFPYLTVDASIADFLPTLEWAKADWSCMERANLNSQINHMAQALGNARLTLQQRKEENRMLERLRVLEKAYGLSDEFDLRQPDNLKTFASILNEWRLIGSEKDNYWEKHYEAATKEMEKCFHSEMKRRSPPQHETVFFTLSRAFEAASAFRAVPHFQTPPTDEERDKLELWLKHITEPISFLKLQEGETFASLQAEQDAIERLLVEPARMLVTEWTAATDTKKQNALREKIDEKLLIPCERCREILSNAITQENLAQADMKTQPSMLALRKTEQSRSKWIASRQRAEQMIGLADRLQGVSADEMAQLRARIAAAETQANARKTKKTDLDGASQKLDTLTNQLRDKLLEIP